MKIASHCWIGSTTIKSNAFHKELIMTQREARNYFKDYILPNIPKNDKPAINEEWGFYLDARNRDGTITDKQYHSWTLS